MPPSLKLLLITYLATLLILPSTSKIYVGYFSSWTDNITPDAASHSIANIPPYVTIINLAFLDPNTTYAAGSRTFDGTGLQFASQPQVIIDAIGIAKSKGAKVLISVGGYTANNWDEVNPDGIAAFVQDFGLDGVDIDFEPKVSDCKVTDGAVSCASDQQFQDVVNRIREKVPDLFVSTAISSVGAYGEGDFANSQPQSIQTGIGLNLMRSDAGQKLDLINIMSYDAGKDYDPTEGFRAYKTYFSKQLALGVEIPPEASGAPDPSQEHVLSIDEVNRFCDFVNENGSDQDGMMIWSLTKVPEGEVSPTNPNANLVSQAICNKFGLPECGTELAIPVREEAQAEVKPVSGVKPRRRCSLRKYFK